MPGKEILRRFSFLFCLVIANALFFLAHVGIDHYNYWPLILFFKIMDNPEFLFGGRLMGLIYNLKKLKLIPFSIR